MVTEASEKSVNSGDKKRSPFPQWRRQVSGRMWTQRQNAAKRWMNYEISHQMAKNEAATKKWVMIDTLLSNLFYDSKG